MLGRRRIRLLVAAVATTLVMGGAGTAWQVQAGFNAAPAAGPASTAQWSGTIVLRNEGQAAATVVLNFYNTAGTLVKSYTVPGTVPAKGTLQVDTEGVPPTTRAVEVVNVTRDDVVVPTDVREQLLDEAPQREGDFFRVPKILAD